MSENIEEKRKRLVFRSWHRGTREIDLILGRFADAHLAEFSAEQLAEYDEFLSNSDPDIFNWISAKESVPANKNSELISEIMKFFKTA